MCFTHCECNPRIQTCCDSNTYQRYINIYDLNYALVYAAKGTHGVDGTNAGMQRLIRKLEKNTEFMRFCAENNIIGKEGHITARGLQIRNKEIAGTGFKYKGEERDYEGVFQ